MKSNTVKPNDLRIGWATRDMTPDQPVILGAQFKMRVSQGVDGPVTVTALALSKDGPEGDSVIFVSCDRGGFRHKWYDENNFLALAREAIRSRSPDIDVNKLILNATHTHTSPMTLIDQFGPEAEVLPDGVMTAKECMDIQCANQGYGSSVYDYEVGPDGGRVIVEETVKALNELWEDCDA